MAVLIPGTSPPWRTAPGAAMRLLCGLALCLALPAAHAGVSEYEVKAAFIHNVAKFVEWPAAPRPGVLRLCVLGRSPFGGALDTLQGKQIGGLAWEVVQAVPRKNLKECGALFVAASESASLEQVLDGVRSSAVLTLGDTEGYAERGVMVNFYLDEDKVRFEINLESAQRAGLKIRSRLIQLGKLVSTPK